MSREAGRPATINPTIDELKRLLFAVAKIEVYDSRELAGMSDMTLDEIQLALMPPLCAGAPSSKENAVLLHSMSGKFAELQRVHLSKVNGRGDARFTLFPKLPPELRRIIWEHALPGGQIIELYCGYRSAPQDGRLEVTAASQRPLGRLSRACHEAREVVRGHYQTIHPRALGVDFLPPRARLLFDPIYDIINLGPTEFIANHFLQCSHTATPLGIQTLATIQNLAINFITFCIITRPEAKPHLEKLTSLQRIFVILREQRRSLMPPPYFPRNWPTRFAPLTLDDIRHYRATGFEQRVMNSLRNPRLAYLRPVIVTFTALTGDSKDQPPLVGDMIQNEIDRLVFLEQVRGSRIL